jgi:signal transduction histidine kinase
MDDQEQKRPSPRRAPRRAARAGGGRQAQGRSQSEYLAAMHETTLGIVRHLDLEVLLQTILERARALAGGNWAFVYLPRPGEDLLERKYSSSTFAHSPITMVRIGEGVVGKVWQTGEPMMVADYRSWQGHSASFQDDPLGPILGVPLKSGSEMTGILGVTRPPDSPPFQQEELDQMVRFAQLASIALDNARLHTSLRQELAERRRAEEELQKAYQTLERRVKERTRELEILNSIAAAVNRSLDLAEVFRYAIGATGEALGLEVGAAFRLDEQTAQGPDPLLTLLAHRGLSAAFLPSIEHMPLRGSMTEVMPDGGPQAWKLSERQLEPVRNALQREGLRFVISVPFVSQGRMLGAMVLGSREERCLSGEEMSLLGAIAEQVSMAVKNARLYDRAQQMAALEERNRLAQELHDSVTQSLYSVTLYAEAAARMLEAGRPRKAADQLREMGDTAREALQEMRLLIFELKPLELERAGLAEALRSRLDAVESRVGLKVDFQVAGEAPIGSPLKLELYHVAREALNNVLKHACARSVSVLLTLGPGEAVLEVKDDGKGFDPRAGTASGGLGLGGMAQRARRVGGELTVQSFPGQGTKVRCRVPLSPFKERE